MCEMGKLRFCFFFFCLFFFFQAEDGIRDHCVTGVQTCALPIYGPYRRADRVAGIREGSIYKSALTGQMGQIGRLWHRMYPWIRLKKDPNDPKKRIPVPRPECFELLTIFPDNLPEARDFIYFLENQQTQFKKLWPVSSRP